MLRDNDEIQQKKNNRLPGWVENGNFYHNKPHATPEENEAQAIIDKTLALIQHSQVTKVGIPYFATAEDANKIHDTYRRHESEINIHWQGQAKVIYHLQRLLKSKYPHLQSVIDILPVTTHVAAGSNNKDNLNNVKNDIRNIKNFINQGGVVFKNWNDLDLNIQLQKYTYNKLEEIAEKYPRRHNDQPFVSESKKDPLQLVQLLLNTLKNPQALFAWPLQIIGINMEKQFPQITKDKMAYAVTREQKEKMLVALINTIKNKSDANTQDEISDAIKAHLPSHLQKLFTQSTSQSNPKNPDTILKLELKFPDLRDKYLGILQDYWYKIDTSKNPLTPQRKNVVDGLCNALKRCSTETQLQEIIDGVQSVHQKLRKTHSDLIPILKSLQYEMTTFLDDHKQNKKYGIRLPSSYQQELQSASRRTTSLNLINKLLHNQTEEEKIRLLNFFSRSLNHIKGYLKDSVNALLDNKTRMAIYPPLESPLRQFTEKHALDFMQYVVDHEQDGKPFFAFAEKDKEYNRHIVYASRLVEKLLQCKTRKELEKIRDEALGMKAALITHKNSHKKLFALLEQIPSHIDQFLKNPDLISSNATPSEKKIKKIFAKNSRTYPKTQLGPLAKLLFLDDTKSIASKCAMIQMLCYSKEASDRQLGQKLLLRVTPEYIEKVKRNNPDCYYAQICLTKLNYLKDLKTNSYLKLLLDTLDTFLNPSYRLPSSEGLFHELRKFNIMIKSDLKLQANSVNKSISTFLDEFLRYIQYIPFKETGTPMIKRIEKEITLREIIANPNLSHYAEEIKKDHYNKLYDTMAYFKSYENEKLSWRDLENEKADTDAYKLILEFLYYTIYPPKADTFSLSALAMLAVLKENVPEKIEGYEIKIRLNHLYDSIYHSQSPKNKELLAEKITHIQSNLNKIDERNQYLAENFNPALKEATKIDFLNELAIILNDPERLTDALNSRASFKERIQSTDLKQLEHDVNEQMKTENTNNFNFHIIDKKRIGATLKKKVKLSWNQLKLMTDFEKMKYEAAIFEAIRVTMEFKELGEQYNAIIDAYNKDATPENELKAHLRDQRNFRFELMRSSQNFVLDHWKKSKQQMSSEKKTSVMHHIRNKF